MARNMSFMLTTDQIIRRVKRVTRRNAATWENLKVGEVLNAVNKSQGLRLGEHPLKLDTIIVEHIRLEPLYVITPQDVALEGFPGWTPEEFIAFYIRHGGGSPDQVVRRIAFDYMLLKQLPLF